MNNATFLADAVAGFSETPARGPYTLAMGNSAIYVSLPHMGDPTYISSIITKIRAIAASDAKAASYLPPDHRTSRAMIAGYRAQLSTLANLLANPQSPSLESPWLSGSAATAFLLHPLSRGTVRLNGTNPLAQPILDYRAGSNPVDFDLHLAHVRFLRRAVDTPTFQKYGAVEVLPGKEVDDADEEALRAFVRAQMTLSFMHPCCTAAMLPEERGGVVGTDLKVHGAGGGLRVVDMSVMPLVPAAHLSATAYAVGEKVSANPPELLAVVVGSGRREMLTDCRLRISLLRSGGSGRIRGAGGHDFDSAGGDQRDRLLSRIPTLSISSSVSVPMLRVPCLESCPHVQPVHP
jgi:hypothetical protein